MNNRRSLKKLSKLSAKILIIATLFFASTYAFEIINGLKLSKQTAPADAQADGAINIWWPTEGARISDTQAFKAIVQDKNASDYDMFWSVDGGQPNPMYDSSADYPHKEAMVDLKGWTWKGGGPYSVTFRAVDHSGNPLGQSSINVYTTGASADVGSNVVESAVTAVSGVTTVAADTVSSTTAVTIVPAAAPSTSVEIAPASIHVIWPSDGANVRGTNMFKAAIDTQSSNTYQMYWQVDDGQLVPMFNSEDGGSHKEASIDVSGWGWKGAGPYKVTFVAKTADAHDLTKTDINITTDTGGQVQNQQSSSSSLQPNPTQAPVVATSATPAPASTPSPSPLAVTALKTLVASASGNPLSGEKFYWDPTNDAKKTADSWRSSRPGDAALMDKIGNTPTSIWLGDWNSDVGGYVKQKISEANSQGTMPVFVVYDIPSRDCGQYSAGGSNSPDGYRSWIQSIADATGNTKAAFILEPDAVALTNCLSSSQLSDRYSLLSGAVSTLKSKPNAHVYIDAAHPNWISADDMASRLTQAGIAKADGFALNTSNFFSTQDDESYGTQISSKLGGKHFVIDTGRNGSGATSDQQWCNPSGRSLGFKPTSNTGNPLVDAFLWLKGPGGSDGNCNGGPAAGVWWSDYALDMAKRSN